MVADPFPTEVTRPDDDTVATVVADEDQLTLAVLIDPPF